jgi:hypothetical protein
MMRAISLAVSVAACATITAAGWSQAGDPPGASAQHGGFAIPDAAGTRLLLIPDIASPERLRTALCTGGGRVQVRFDRQQVAREGGNRRVTAGNFDYLAGRVFGVIGGSIDAGAACLLASDSLLNGSTILSVGRGDGSACAARDRLSQLRDRPIVRCWPLGRASASAAVVLVEFERRGKDALASVVVVDGNRTVFADYPAEYRGADQDLWRADDAGELSPQGFEIVCLTRRGDQYALGIAWRGPEGTSLSLWISDGDRFIQALKDYHYHAPI